MPELFLFVFAVTTLVLAVALAFVYFSYRSQVKEYFALRRETETLRLNALHLEDMLEAERGRLKQQLEKISEIEANKYQATLDEVKTQIEENLQQISTEALEASLKEVKGVSLLVKQKVEAEHQRVTAELEAFKAERLTQIEAQVQEMLSKLSAKVLGEAIDVKQHEELIFKALEEAKKDVLL